MNTEVLKALDRQNLKMSDLETFERCCTYLHISPALPDVSMLPVKYAPGIVSNYKLWVISEAWNKKDSFMPDYGDYNQNKHYPWFIYDKITGRFIFRHSNFFNSPALAGTGSRFCFKSAPRAKKFGEMFIDLHNDVLLLERINTEVGILHSAIIN